jgi:Xaa-Pro dipeptidase
MKIFDSATIQNRRSRLQKSLQQELSANSVLLIFCGEPLQKPGGLDQTYPFLPHPEYFWITGLRRPSGVVAYSARIGWTDFVQPTRPEERLWEGTTEEFEGLDVQAI